MKLLSEVLKVDLAIPAQALAPAAQAVSDLFPMRLHRKLLAVVHLVAATLEDGDILDIGLVDDTQVVPAASGALAVLEAAGLAVAFEHITASTHVASLWIETVGSADGAIVINGTTFAFVNPPVLATDWNSAATLAAAITAAGLGLTATDAGTEVTIVVDEPGATDITMTETVTNIIAADILTLEAVAYLEVDASALPVGATGVWIVVDNPVANTGTATLGAVVLRGEPRYAPVDQTVAAP